MSKHLHNMPDHVRNSAWANRKTALGVLMDGTANFLYMALSLLVGFAWWTYAYWILAEFVPFEFVKTGIPTMRDFILGSYLFVACLAFLAYVMNLIIQIPWADTSYPLINDGGLLSRNFYWLSFHTIAFGALLVAAGATKTHGAQGITTHLQAALILIAVGAAAFAFAKWQPAFGLKVPSSQQVEVAVRATQAIETSQAETQSADYATPVEGRAARHKFADIYGMQSVKDKLLVAGQRIVADRQPGTDAPPNGMLLHGEPGNGKTVFAEALAGELGVPFIELTYGDVASKWVGDMPRQISNCFAYAKREAPCVLFLDEIDSFITSRDSGSNNSEDQKITNTLLTEIVNIRSHRVVLMGATNYLGKLDPAAIREGRFDMKVEITAPDEPARIGLLAHGVKKHAPGLVIDEADMLSVAKRWNGFSVSRLTAVAKALPDYAREAKVERITHKDWMGALRSVQGRSGRVPENTKKLEELILDAETREALTMVADRLSDVARIEALGGTLPNGIVFHGPPGTGKTAAARALAKQSGWAFLSTAGPDLIADREKLTKLYREALDIRPAIIFIDEADDVVRNRQYSSTPDLTNRMLVLMDGTDDKVKDVVWVAATNHPDQMDPALLRAGRFTEKVQFSAPPADQIPRHVAGWLKARKVVLEAGVDAFDVASMLEGQTIANIDGVLQYALNRAISEKRGGEVLQVSKEDLAAGMRVVLEIAT